MKKIIIFTLLLSFWIVPSDVVLAQASNFVPCDGVDCSACDFVTMANVIIKWFFGIVFLIFAILMAKAGFGLVTSGGSQSALESAKSMFQNAIIGLLIVMAGWLIVDILMRNLVKGDGDLGATFNGFGPWAEVQCQVQIQTFKWEGDPASVGASPVPPLPGPAPTTCSGSECAPLGIPCKVATSCSISPDLVDNFQAMHAAAGVPGAWVSEGMPPTRVHKSKCHTEGTCIDYSKPGGMTSAEVVSVINAATANGLRPVYEVQTTAQKNALVEAGAPAGSIAVLGNWISAPHFSIYGY